MKTRNSLIIAITVLILSSFTSIAIREWLIKEDAYAIKFSTKKASGTIAGLKGKIHFDEQDLPHSTIDVTVDVNTLDMGFFLKTNHAKEDDFLHVEKYPTIRFVSQKFTKSGNTYVVNGNLTIKNNTKTVTIPFQFDPKSTSPAFVGTFEINRLDYGLADKKGVGELLQIQLKVPVTIK